MLFEVDAKLLAILGASWSLMLRRREARDASLELPEFDAAALPWRHVLHYSRVGNGCFCFCASMIDCTGQQRYTAVPSPAIHAAY
jgi:hypothetical protein